MSFAPLTSTGRELALVQVRAADNMEAAFVQLPRLISAVNALGFQAEPYFGSEDDGDSG